MSQHFKFQSPRSFLSSSGLGTMGFGLPSAMGVQAAYPDRLVVDIDGDGSFLMNVQELATCYCEKLPVKVMLLNNQHLGMVVQWEDRFYGSVRGNTILGDEKNVGGPDNPAGLYPDFVKIAEGFGIKGRRIMKKSELKEAIQEMLDHDGPYLLDVIVPYTSFSGHASVGTQTREREMSGFNDPKFRFSMNFLAGPRRSARSIPWCSTPLGRRGTMLMADGVRRIIGCEAIWSLKFPVA